MNAVIPAGAASIGFVGAKAVGSAQQLTELTPEQKCRYAHYYKFTEVCERLDYDFGIGHSDLITNCVGDLGSFSCKDAVRQRCPDKFYEYAQMCISKHSHDNDLGGPGPFVAPGLLKCVTDTGEDCSSIY